MLSPGAARRWALGIEYDGSDFVGWQRQNTGRSVQAELEAALAAVATGPIATCCAGRTDAGVHALGQVVHFDSAARRDPHNWLLGTNARLPSDVAVRWVREVPPAFHARYSAAERRYRYLVIEGAARPALHRRRAAWVRRPLEVAPMSEASRLLLGEHDFSAFRAAGCQARSPVRTIFALEVFRCAGFLCFEVAANAFLHHMVRNIVGSLLVIGRGEERSGWLGEILRRGDRRLAGPTAPARGLVLTGVRYPSRFGLPAEANPAASPETLGL